MDGVLALILLLDMQSRMAVDSSHTQQPPMLPAVRYHIKCLTPLVSTVQQRTAPDKKLLGVEPVLLSVF